MAGSCTHLDSIVDAPPSSYGEKGPSPAHP